MGFTMPSCSDHSSAWLACTDVRWMVEIVNGKAPWNCHRVGGAAQLTVDDIQGFPLHCLSVSQKPLADTYWQLYMSSDFNDFDKCVYRTKRTVAGTPTSKSKADWCCAMGVTCTIIVSIEVSGYFFTDLIVSIAEDKRSMRQLSSLPDKYIYVWAAVYLCLSVCGIYIARLTHELT